MNQNKRKNSFFWFRFLVLTFRGTTGNSQRKLGLAIATVPSTTPSTPQSMENPDCEIFFQSGKGYGNTLVKGINNCQTELFCIFNADGSFDPKELINMLNKLKIEN